MNNAHCRGLLSPVRSSAYDPNRLSIFPELLQPVNATETQQRLEPPVVQQHSAREDEMCPAVRILNIVEQLMSHTTLGLDGLIQSLGEPRAVAPRSTSSTHRTRRAPSRTRAARPRTLARQQHSCANSNSGVPQLPQEEPEAELPRENNVDCPICMAPFCQPTTTRCGHVFCKNCITHAMVEKKQCPICRKRVTKRDLFRIYLS